MYLTAAEYVEITGHDQAEATTARLRRACMFFDARIGYYERNDDGYKLDIDGVTNYQANIIREWVAWMAAYLAENGDESPSAASLSLGRFSVTEHGQQGQLIPEQINMVDALLAGSGLINKAARLKHRAVSEDESEI